MKNLLLATLLLTITFPLSSQNYCPTWEWAKKISDVNSPWVSSMQPDGSGNFYLSGPLPYSVTLGSTTLNVSNILTDGFVAKMDSNGNWLWAKKIDKVQVTSSTLGPNNELFITGTFNNITILGNDTLYPLPGAAFNSAVALLDSNGNYIWAKAIAGRNFDISSDAQGNVVFVGQSQLDTLNFESIQLTKTGGIGGYIIKVNSQGNAQWSNFAGGRAENISTANTGESWVSGSFGGLTSFDNILVGPSDTRFFGFIDSTGNWQWVKTDTALSYSELEFDNISSCFVLGKGTNPITSSNEFNIAKINKSGQWIWANSGGSAASPIGFSSFSYSFNMDADKSGNGYFTGTFSTGGNVFGQDTLKIVGGGRDLFVAKINSAGQWQWAGMGGGPLDEVVGDIAVNRENTIYLTGQFTTTCYLGLDTLRRTSSGTGIPFFNAKITGRKAVTVKAMPDETIHCGDSIQLKAFTNSAATLNYHWGPNAGSVTNPIVNPRVTTTYTVVGSRGNGCMDSAQVTITVDPNISGPANLVFSSSTGNFSFCQNGFTLSAPLGHQTYQWSTGDTTQTISPSKPGIYVVTVNNSQGCFLTDSIIITPLSQVTSSSGYFYLCPNLPNDSLELQNLNAVDSLLWSTGNKTNSIWVSNPGKYWMQVWKNGCSFIDTVKVKTLNNVTANFSYSINGNKVNFTPLSNGIASYQWYFGDGSNDIVSHPTHQYFSKAKYTVCLEVVSICGERDTVCKEVDLNNIGINELNLSSIISVYPNPVSDILFVKLNAGVEEKGTTEILIFSSNGLLVKNIKPSPGSVQKIDMSEVSSGLYLLKFGNYKFKFLKR